MALDLDGPRLPPANGAPPRKLVIFLHGFGADGNDLIQIGRQWAEALPDAAFIAPHAPEPCAMGGGGRQWFELTFRDPGEYWRGVSAAGPGLDRFIDRERDRYGLSDADVALVGFSQGTMMSLHIAPRRAQPIAALVGFSGRLLQPEALAAETTAKPPVLLIHGDADPMVPVQSLPEAADALVQAGFETYAHVCKGLGHSIDNEGLSLALGFLHEKLPA